MRPHASRHGPGRQPSRLGTRRQLWTLTGQGSKTTPNPGKQRPAQRADSAAILAPRRCVLQKLRIHMLCPRCHSLLYLWAAAPTQGHTHRTWHLRRPHRRSTPIQLIRAPAGIGMVRRHRRSGGVLGHILGRSGCLFWGHRRAGGSVAWKTIQLRSGRAHPFFHSFTNDGQMHKPLSLSQNCNNVRMSGMFNISCGSIRVWGDDGSPDLCGQRVNSLWQNRSPPPSLKNRAGGKGKKKSSLKTTKEDASGKIEV